MGAKFWGAYPSFGPYCIPDVDVNPLSIFIPFLGGYAACNTVNYAKTPYSIYPCCYDNGSNFDLVKRSPTTTFYALRNAE
jgi:hypothetical protein